jgi:hypothetical protein
VDSLYDNRDISLIAQYKHSERDFFSELHGYRFPVDYKDAENPWLKLQSYIPLIFQQLLTPGGPELQIRASAEEFEDFIQNSNLSPTEGLHARIVLLFLKHGEGQLVVKEMESVFVELERAWTSLESQLEQRFISLEEGFFVDLTLLLEAWNTACLFAASEKDRAWKSILIKQLKHAKKVLTKANTVCTSEPVPMLAKRSTLNIPQLSV